ncbi:SDR family oxidoreductase [Serratia proteamaculans]|uniref:SDR family oxidoreductase n=1 Tax=Serratia proteamaculans TaxID=28151 RepID=UPI0021834729|nr:SDR family oxidoreductase [Serratia proteamaculans]CAI2414863.1 3-oxoacyl-[acyl-carrier-protein] reductase FabG [Serratia proteamaculans]
MTTPSSSLNRQKLVILGGNSGIGAAVAYAAIERGANVVLASRRVGSMQQYQPADGGGNLRVMQADVTDENSLRALFAEIGEFDHLVFTAGPAVQARLLAETDFDEAQANFDVKLWGALRAIKAALPTLSPRGSITLTSGQLSRKYLSGQLIKTGINAALEAVGKQLAKELAPRRVNVVSPGVTATEAYDALNAEQRQAMFAKTGAGLPVGRVGLAAEVAAGYLLAMENGFVTGSVIDIDGGGLL